MRTLCLTLTFLLGAGLQIALAEEPSAEPSTPASAPEAPAVSAPAAAQEMTTGNGKANWIRSEDATRDGATFSFPEVRIEGNGWLVMHPFKDGKPVGDVYVGATYIEDGDNRDVAITIDSVPEAGEMFIVMLHRDVNENQVFDFVFVDERNVLDKAVFEGTMMIGHPFAAPE